MQARDPPVERRAHPGEDNGTRTRTPALTTRRLSLRLCPPQEKACSNSLRARRVVGSRGFEPRSARSERAASADCATSRCGDHGRIRTATGQALDLLPLPDWATWPLVPPGGLEPPPPGSRARHAALTLQSGWSRHGGSNPDLGRTRAACFRCHHGDVERVAGFEPVVISLEG
jgi:hypothetical protein